MENSTKTAGVVGGLILTVVGGVLVNVLTDFFKPWTSRENASPPARMAAEAETPTPAKAAPSAPSPRSEKPITSKSITIPDDE